MSLNESVGRFTVAWCLYFTNGNTWPGLNVRLLWLADLFSSMFSVGSSSDESLLSFFSFELKTDFVSMTQSRFMEAQACR